jgi:hypothetical protein
MSPTIYIVMSIDSFLLLGALWSLKHGLICNFFIAIFIFDHLYIFLTSLLYFNISTLHRKNINLYYSCGTYILLYPERERMYLYIISR